MNKEELIRCCERNVNRLIREKSNFLREYEFRKNKGIISEELYKIVKIEIEAEIKGMNKSLLLCIEEINKQSF